LGCDAVEHEGPLPERKEKLMDVKVYQQRREMLDAQVKELLLFEKMRIAATLHLQRNPESSRVKTLREAVSRMESDLEASISRQIEDMPGYDWLIGIKGIGPAMAAYVIGLFDATKPSVSHWWSYAGLAVDHKWTCECGEVVHSQGRGPVQCPSCKKEISENVSSSAPKARRGAKLTYNPMVRTIAWRIGSQLRKTDGFYFKMYEEWKKDEAERTDAGKAKTESHMKARALRKTIKLFLSHAYEAMRVDLGLPEVKPYIIAYPNVHLHIPRPPREVEVKVIEAPLAEKKPKKRGRIQPYGAA